MKLKINWKKLGKALWAAVRPTLSLCDLHPQGKGLSG